MVDLQGAASATPAQTTPDAPAVKGKPRVLARLLADWERTVAVAIAIVTLSAALLTYLAVRQDDAAAEARGQATLETLQLEREQLVAATRVDGESSATGRYRRSLAEAEALESQATAAQSAGNPTRAAQLRAEALVLRSVADAFRQTTFDMSRLNGTTSAATYDAANRIETIKGYEAFGALQPEQPAHTAAAADARHDQSIRTMLAVVTLLVLVLLLTVGRMVRPRWRTAVLAAAAAGFLIATVGAGINAAVGG